MPDDNVAITPYRRARTWSTLLATTLLVTMLHGAHAVSATAFATASGTASAASGGQAAHGVALFGIKAAQNAAAQEFVADVDRLSRVSLYLSSGASTGQITVQVRTARGDAGSAIATRTLDLADLGGSGAGWLEVPLDAALQPGATYYLFAQATTTEDKPVVWYGTRQAGAGAPVSWNYDGSYWGGWHAETAQLAYHVNPAGSERCGETDRCYVPSSVLAARTSGLLTDQVTVEAVDPPFSVGARYVEGSNVLLLPSGRWRYLPAGGKKSVLVEDGDGGAAQQIAESRRWLATGRVPGAAGVQRASAERALLSMRALLQPNGAFAAAWAPLWDYSWPRDSSFAAAAFAHTGHQAEAYQILQYNAKTQRADGTWAARTLLDGSGPPDSRTWQLDGNGWVPWATWQWYRAAPADTRLEGLRALYPMVVKAADRAAGSLDAEGLPPASPDYWELPTSTTNIGTAAPLLAGLNAAADLARTLGHDPDAARWTLAAQRLSAGIAKRFAPLGYQRTVDGLHGHDSAAAFMAPPFNSAPADLPAALDTTYAALRRHNGGIVPGDDAEGPWTDIAWTPSTGFFALAWATLGQRDKADQVLDWVLSKRNGLGELPETVNASGQPRAAVPLGWTDAIVLMALLAQDGTPLPKPPLPAPTGNRR